MKQEYFHNDNEQWYMTSGIDQSMHIFHQTKLIELLNQLRDTGLHMDYLQVFEFKYDREHKQMTVIHTQEQPEYRNVITYDIDEAVITPFEDKVYIIDDVEHITILLASEY